MIALALTLARGRKRTHRVTAASSLGVPAVAHSQLSRGSRRARRADPPIAATAEATTDHSLAQSRPRAAFSLVSGSVVLTIGKLGASKGQLQYYERQVAAGMEHYYAGRGEARGVWRSRAGAEVLGLAAG